MPVAAAWFAMPLGLALIIGAIVALVFRMRVARYYEKQFDKSDLVDYKSFEIVQRTDFTTQVSLVFVLTMGMGVVLMIWPILSILGY